MSSTRSPAETPASCTSRSAQLGSSRWKPHRVVLRRSFEPCRPGTEHHHARRHAQDAGRSPGPARANFEELRGTGAPGGAPGPKKNPKSLESGSGVDDHRVEVG